MKRIWFVLFLINSIFFLTACHRNSHDIVGIQSSDFSDNSRPNIIFLLSDDQRFDALGVAGNRILQTRNLDSLANNGMYFTNAYATTSICAVSRASILCGQYARRHRIFNFNTDFSETDFEQTYPMLLKKNGYNIAFIGKYGVGDNAPKDKFDFWRGFNGQGHYITPDENGKPTHILRLTQQQITQCIDDFGSKKSPFFLQVSFKAPHAEDENAEGEEFVFDPAYSKYYNDIQWQLPEAANPQYRDYFPPSFTNNNESCKRWKKRFSTPTLINKSMQGYYRLIHHMDDVIGSLLAQLREKKLDKNTIIIFASDNGYYLGEYGFADKWYGSSPSIRVPMIVYDPRPAALHGVRSNSMVLNIDIAPTILNYAQVATPEKMQGKPLNTQALANTRNYFFYEHLWTYGNINIPSTEGVVGNRFKYMRYFKGVDSTNLIFEEMYDLLSDPRELNNLVQKPEWATQKDSLKNTMWQLKKSVH